MTDVMQAAELAMTDGGSLLYHYTTENSFRSIIERRQLWATSPLDMNDASEFRYGWEIVNEIARGDEILYASTRAVLHEILPGIDLKKLLRETFLVCASLEGDLTHQWVDYAKKMAYAW